MLVVMELGLVVVALVIVRAQLENVRQRRKQEQQHFQHELFGRTDAQNEGQQPKQFDFDEFDEQHDGDQRQDQLVAEEFLCWMWVCVCVCLELKLD